jgi:hypothetical protein
LLIHAGKSVFVGRDVRFVGEIPGAALDAVEADILAFPGLAKCGG